ncbi:hypothetical protein [Chroogloeocystis siderophila]|jgi:hypothetical protein|uniref:Uncharacterized protein n=1 Tax=Chroogloeocystis siderophila 5.2 s.c.1 TaxID=247279 RepID=A0A1U7HRY9_9CHRO|nr:hypothetical protein [Chroogloeocystis siderophila]OKH26341.1 hypothetical protein NIES1031_11270 [Chroogloeocystis siderophila 5.2 s.c.1]
MRRRFYKQSIPTQNLDSFLDILTNTVGVLMFVGLFVSVVAVQSATIVRTPVVSDSDKVPQFFEVRGNKVIPLDSTTVNREFTNFSNSLPSCDEPELPINLDVYSYQYYQQQRQEYHNCINNKISQVKNFRIQTAHYEIRINLNSSIGLIYEPLRSDSGESTQELMQVSSEFHSLLKTFNPQTDYLAFIVRPDSFVAFRRAREIAWQKGFDVGWEPMQQDVPIEFSSQGRAVSVQ